MFRLFGVVCLLFAVLCGVLLFYTSQSVQRAERGLSEVSYDVMSEEESLRILTAEWDYLNRPERLEKIISGNFEIDQDKTTLENFVSSADQIPEPLIPVVPKMKPTNLFQEVAIKNKALKKRVQPVTIDKKERERFDNLLNDVATGGEQ